MHKQPSEIRAVLAKAGSAVIKRRLAGLNTSTLRVDHLHADNNVGGAAVTRRAHKQRAVGQSATDCGATAGKGAKKGQAQTQWRECLPDLLPGHPCLDGDHQILFVDRDNPVQRTEVEHHRIGLGGQIATRVGHAATALGHCPTGCGGNAHGVGHLLLRVGPYHHGRRHARTINICGVKRPGLVIEQAFAPQRVSKRVLHECLGVSRFVHRCTSRAAIVLGCVRARSPVAA